MFLSKINYNKETCVLHFWEKNRREYYQNLSVENICDNKTFWQVVKPLMSNKIMSSEKIALSEGTKIFKNDIFFDLIFENLNDGTSQTVFLSA